MRAARLAGLTTLDCVMFEEVIADDELLAIQWVENASRGALKPVEKARAYRRLIDAKGWSTRELAAELAIAQNSVVRALALLDLPAAVQEQVEQGVLGPTVAYEVGKLKRAEDQVAVAQVAVEQGLRCSEVAELAQAVRARRPTTQASTKPGPVSLDMGDVVVQVRWKKSSPTSALQALRRGSGCLIWRKANFRRESVPFDFLAGKLRANGLHAPSERAAVGDWPNGGPGDAQLRRRRAGD